MCYSQALELASLLVRFFLFDRHQWNTPLSNVQTLCGDRIVLDIQLLGRRDNKLLHASGLFQQLSPTLLWAGPLRVDCNLKSYKRGAGRIKIKVLPWTDANFQNIAFHCFQVFVQISENLFFQRSKHFTGRFCKLGFATCPKSFVPIARNEKFSGFL